EFRTLLQRVGKLAGVEVSSGGTPAAAPLVRERPQAKLLLDEELGDWLAKSDTPAVHLSEVGDGFEAGVATPDASVLIQWQPGGRDYAQFEAWLASDAPKIFFDAKQQIRVARRAGC